MTDWIDFKELRRQLDFADVLRQYGVELKLKGDQHHGFCPLPGHKGKKNSPSFSANLKRGIWQCFGCGRGGNILDFVLIMEGRNPKSGKDVREVAKTLQEKIHGKQGKSADQNGEQSDCLTPLSEEEDVRANLPLDFELKGLDASHPYLLGRGFTRETIANFGLGYCSRGLLGKRIAIPLHNELGQLIGYAGRVIDDETITEENPKYKFPGRRKRKDVLHEFRKSRLLYNAHRIAAPVHDLIVVEGFAGVWWMWQARILNIVSPMGASCSEEQATIIVSLVSPGGRVWIFTDGDAAGERCAHEIFGRVAPHRFVRWIRLEGGKQPTGFSVSELKDLFPFSAEALQQ